MVKSEPVQNLKGYDPEKSLEDYSNPRIVFHQPERLWYTPITERAQQYYILLKKFFKLSLRSWKTSLVQLLAPLAFLVALLILQVVPHPTVYENGNEPDPITIGTIPPCKPFAHSFCYTMMFAPANDPSSRPIVDYIAQKNGYQIVDFNEDPSKMPSGSIVACESIDQIINFMWSYQNVTQTAVDFDPPYSYVGQDDLDHRFEYNILFNNTCLRSFSPGVHCPNYRYAVQRSIDEALAVNVTSTNTTISVQRRAYPIVTFNTALNDTVSTYGILFFYCGMMFSFVIVLYQIVYEKERQLKKGMKLMGLKSSVYWITWFISGSIMNLIATLVMIAGGYACQFVFFLDTNFFVLFLMFYLFSEAMLVMSFFVTTFLDTSKSAISAGMLIFIVGILLQMLLSSPALLTFVFYDSYWVSTMLYYILIWYPPFNFAKCVEDVSSMSFDYGQFQGSGYSWDTLFVPLINSEGITLPPTIQSFYLLIINLIVYAVLTWFFENVLPGETGKMQPPWFFLLKDYFGIPRGSKPPPSGPLQRSHEDPSTIDPDVLREDEIAHTPCEANAAVRIVRLSKTYRKLPFIPTRWDVQAQDSVSLNIPQGSLFCLLGHNGAGKTTTINILTGLFPSSSGEAYIYGRNVRTEMNEIRHSMGVCPQHDILWDEMTAREHLELFCYLKNVPSQQREAMIAEKLEMVRLTRVGNNRVGSYSGGMKRRLSVAISSIGEPDIIFLDEPTTGMDPMSRRHVWELIERMKKNRVIILTTHSMEEADVLGDRIAIMAHGKVRCVGNSLHLKNRFGDGYRINIATNIDQVPLVKEQVQSYLPQCSLIAESGGSLVFGVNVNDHHTLVPLFRYLEEEERKGSHSIVKDWGISQTSLEDVFLKVTRQVYSGGNRIDGVPVV